MDAIWLFIHGFIPPDPPLLAYFCVKILHTPYYEMEWSFDHLPQCTCYNHCCMGYTKSKIHILRSDWVDKAMI